ncbi:MAG: hypothetical protein WKF96_23690, partial [Solirubrobacteraceae bacterium]
RSCHRSHADEHRGESDQRAQLHMSFSWFSDRIGGRARVLEPAGRSCAIWRSTLCAMTIQEPQGLPALPVVAIRRLP